MSAVDPDPPAPAVGGRVCPVVSEERAERAPVFLGARVLVDQDTPGRHLLLVDFSSQEEAEANSDREATSNWAAGLRDLAGGEPTFRNLGLVYSTSG